MKRVFASLAVAALLVSACVQPLVPDSGKEQGGQDVEQPDNPGGNEKDPLVVIIDNDDFGGSGDSGNSDPQLVYDYKMGEHTVNVTDDIMEKISDVSATGFTLNTNGGNSPLKTNDVVVFPISETFPEGYASKVQTVFSNFDGSYTYTTTQAALDDIFENLHFSQTAFDITDYVKGIEAPDGTFIPATKAAAGFSIKVPEIFGGLNSLSIDIGDNYSFSPSMEVSFTLDIDADVVDHKLTYARVRADATSKMSCSVSMKASESISYTSPAFKVIVGAIPIGPLVLTPTIYVTFEIKLSGEVNISFTVNDEASYYALAFYNGDDVKVRAGKNEIPDKKDPFEVSGNLGGSIEFGPNIGVAISAYGGALGLSVDFYPHIVFSVVSSFPICAETLMNLDMEAEWLANAYYEPSLSFNFGGSIHLAYKWKYSIKVPENMALAYSFGKTYILPKLREEAKFHVRGLEANMKTGIVNKSLFQGPMFYKLYEFGFNDQLSVNNTTPYRKVEVQVPDYPKAEDEEVECTASITGLKQGMRYHLAGPYMTISLFGREYDIKMAPRQQFSDYFFPIDEQLEGALRGILTDIYNCRKGDWKWCNWTDPEADAFSWKRLDINPSRNGGIYVYIRGMGLAEDAGFGDNLIVGQHTGDLSLGWRLEFNYHPSDLSEKDKSYFDTIEILDNGYHGVQFPVRQKAVIHSSRFDGTTWLDPAYPDVTLDFSGSGLNYLELRDEDRSHVTVTGNLILNNCPNLTSIRIKPVTPSMGPKGISYLNCPNLKELIIKDCKNTAINLEGRVEQISIENTPLGSLSLCADDCNDFYSNSIQSMTFTAGSYLASISLGNCESLYISDCSSLLHLGVDGDKSDPNNRWKGSLCNFSISGCPSLRTVRIHSPSVGGTLPDDFLSCWRRTGDISYPYKYEYDVHHYDEETGKAVMKLSETHSNGYYVPGEPQRPFNHYGTGKYYDEE